MEEKFIKGHEYRYSITCSGKVISLPKNRTAPYGGEYLTKRKELKQEVMKNGYHRVRLSNGERGNDERHLVHRLVAIHFIQNPKNKPCVNHLDGDKSNNHKDNLQWVTYSENSQHGYENGLISVPSGEDCHLSKLSNKDVYDIKDRLKNGEKHKDIAKDYGVTRSNITMISTGRSWN